jgi:hypothetical protein
MVIRERTPHRKLIRTCRPKETDIIRALSKEDLDTLFISPDIYVRDVDWTTCEAVCVRMSRKAYSLSSFLDDRTIPAIDGEVRIPVAELMDVYNEQRPQLQAPMIIAHTALCGSTLLTRCIDMPGLCLPYREPYLFHNLSGIWRLGFQSRVHRRVGRTEPPILDLAMALVSRTYDETEKPVVKLSDTCTSLLPSILARSPGSRILLLYHELTRFLVAMLRLPDRRQYARNMRIRAEVDLRAIGKPEALAEPELSDGRCAALVWMGLMYPYLRLLAAAPDRIRSLNAAVFLEDPLRTLKQLDAFFCLGIGQSGIEERLAEGALSRHSKNADRDFDADTYRTDLESAATEFQDEIDDAVNWVARVTAAEPLPEKLPNAL